MSNSLNQEHKVNNWNIRRLIALQQAGLKISKEKRKYILITRNERRYKGRIRIGIQSFEKVQEFKCLGSTFTENNERKEEIKARRYYYCLLYTSRCV